MKNLAKQFCGIALTSTLLFTQSCAVSFQHPVSLSSTASEDSTETTSDSTTLTISPTSYTMADSNTKTFTTSGGKGTITFSVFSGNGSIDSSTGEYTAPSSVSAAETAVIRATDEAGNTADASVTINPVLSISPAAAGVMTSGTIDFTGVNGVAPYTYEVSVGSGSINSSGQYTASGAMDLEQVRVTDSLGNTAEVTVHIFSGATLWLMADDIDADGDNSNWSDNDSVSTWSDHSGNSNDVTASGGARPTYQSTAGANSNPGVQFNGTSNVMARSSLFNGTASDATIIAALAPSSNGSVVAVYDSATGTDDGFRMDCAVSTMTAYAQNNSGTGYSSRSSSNTCNANVVATTKHEANGSTENIYKNSKASTLPTSGLGSSAHSFTGRQVAIGYHVDHGSYLNGTVSEIFVFPSSLSDADRNVVECYLGTKYSVTLVGASCTP